MSDPLQTAKAPSRPPLGVLDAVSIILGIVVGTAIFKSPMMVFQNVSGPWQALGVWLLGGLLSLCGALCYAELAAAYPINGGEYEYLKRAFGKPVGTIFVLAQLIVVLSGSIGAMAYTVSDYAIPLWHLPARFATELALGVILLLTLINAVGMTVGKSLQNLLSLAKVLGLLGVVASGLAGRTNSIATERAEPTILGPGFGLAMVFVLYAYGGWNHAVLVTAEVRDPRRNLPRALAGGVSAVTIVYLAVNAAYLVGLGFDEARRSPTPASDLVARAFGPAGGRFLSLLVITSALGAVNGMILTGRALFATLAADDPPLARRLATKPRLIPILSLGILAGCSLLLLFLVGTESGRAMVDFPPRSMGLHTLPWHEFPGGFELLVAASAPVFWFFFLLTALALFVLRNKEPDQVRPFLVPFYPWTPLLFGAASAYMLYSSLEYARWLAIAGVVPVLLAIPLYLLARRAWSAHEP